MLRGLQRVRGRLRASEQCPVPEHAMPPAAAVLDLRRLVAPEPLERALAAAERLEPGACIEVLTPMMPFPLIELLGDKGLDVVAERLPDGAARIAIRRPG